MSEELKAEVNKAIEIQKVKCSNNWEEIFSEVEKIKRFSTKWSDQPVVIDFNYLTIVLETGKPIRYTINTGFHDAVNGRLNPIAVVNVDLSAHVAELKKAIIHVLVDKFF